MNIITIANIMTGVIIGCLLVLVAFEMLANKTFSEKSLDEHRKHNEFD